MISDNLIYVANHLWQSTLFTAGVWLLTLVLRENRAAIRHSLWFAASVKFLVPFSLLIDLGSLIPVLPVPEYTRLRATVFVESIGQLLSFPAPIATAPPQTSVFTASSVLLVAWGVGFIASMTWWAVQWSRLYGAARRATPSNLNAPIRVLACQGPLEPGVFGIFRPVLLLPAGITHRLTAEQMKAVLAHEFCHVRRRDNLTAAIHMFVEAVFWFYPPVWWIKSRLVDEQERACDEAVLREGNDPKVYAESVLQICEFYLTTRLMCVSGITGSNLKRRIEEIMKNRDAGRLSVKKTILLAVVAIVVLVGPILIGMTKPGFQAGEKLVSVLAPAPQPPRVAEPAEPVARPLPRRGQREASPVPAGEYRIGEVKVTGNRQFQSDLLQSTLGLIPGEIYDESRLRSGFRNLMGLYGSAGYVTFIPEPEIALDEQRKLVNLNIRISEGPQYTVNSITIVGNQMVASQQIKREIPVSPGEIFNASLLDIAVRRLNQLGLFEEIRRESFGVQPVPNETKVDLFLKVTEK